MTNQSILMLNLESTFTPDGFKEFAWAIERDKTPFYAAEKHVRQWESVLGLLQFAMPLAANQHTTTVTEAALTDLHRFFRDRLRNMNFGGNQ